ncbi:MAG TPA: AMP-binding protein [Anaeromyxobacteraceae bacterium]|nr:AMP-binding protein [Anaeromyxobacteraceae bacterium]
MPDLDTYPKYLLHNHRLFGEHVALRRKDRGIWTSYTWSDCYHQVRLLCLGLVELGLRPGDKVCIVGDDEPEGFWAEAAIQSGGGTVVAMWSDSVPSEIAYVIQHSDARFVIAEDQEQVDKILEIRDSAPGIQRVVYWDSKGLRRYQDPVLLGFEGLRQLGAERAARDPQAFEELVARTEGVGAAQISYTSGTTSLPKGAVITHQAILASARRMQEVCPLGAGEDVITTLATASVFHSWFAGYNYMSRVVINFPEEPETLMQDFREISPRFLLITPRQWESLSSMTQTRIADAGFLKRSAYRLLLPVGYRVADLRAQGRPVPLGWRLLHALADLVLFAPLRDKLGLTRTRYPFTGSAFLSPDFFRFFQAIGVHLRQIYGSTEAGVVSMHPEDDVDNDSVGVPCHGAEVRISETQEILVRGPSVFCEYYKNPEKTGQVIRDGWFHTGDSGHVGEGGHLFYLDRIDNLDELRNGHRYAPAYIEGKLKFSRYIQDAMAVGGKSRDFLSVLINIDFESIGKWAEGSGVPYTTFADLSQKEEVGALIRGDLERVNHTLPPEARVRRFVLLPKEFDADEGELTRTRKLKRQFLQTRYGDLIDSIYDGKTEVPMVTEVKYRDGRRGKVSTNLKVRSVYETKGETC